MDEFGRSKDYALYCFSCIGCLDDILSTNRVDVVVMNITVFCDVSSGRKMYDCGWRKTQKDFLQVFLVEQIDMVKICLMVFFLWFNDIDGTDITALVEQIVNQIGSNKTGPTSDENPFLHTHGASLFCVCTTNNMMTKSQGVHVCP